LPVDNAISECVQYSILIMLNYRQTRQFLASWEWTCCYLKSWILFHLNR